MLGLDTAYTNKNFDHSSFSRSRDMVGAHQNLNGSGYLTTPRSGSRAIDGLALATVTPSTKF